MTLQDVFNSRFQDLLYTLIDSKDDGLNDCTVTEIINTAAIAFEVAEEDYGFIPNKTE